MRHHHQPPSQFHRSGVDPGQESLHESLRRGIVNAAAQPATNSKKGLQSCHISALRHCLAGLDCSQPDPVRRQHTHEGEDIEEHDARWQQHSMPAIHQRGPSQGAAEDGLQTGFEMGNRRKRDRARQG